MIIDSFNEDIRTGDDDTVFSFFNDQIFYGLQGNDTIISLGSSVLAGGSGDDTYFFNFSSINYIADTSGDNDILTESTIFNGSLSDVLVAVIIDGNDRHLSILDASTGAGVVIFNALDVNENVDSNTGIELVEVGPVLRAIINSDLTTFPVPQDVEIGDIVPFSRVLSAVNSRTIVNFGSSIMITPNTFAGQDIDVNDLAPDVREFFSEGSDFVFAESARLEELSPSNADDEFFGTGENDEISLFGGADIYNGFAGDDSINAGSGNDIIFGEAGQDNIIGGAGDDLLLAGAGDDSINGGEDNDIIEGNDGADTINGDGGEDLIFGGVGDDLINGGADNDILIGGVGNDTLNGGDGDDSVLGMEGADSIDGGLGNDLLLGGAGADTIIGDDGNDTIETGDGNNSANGGIGDDIILGGSNADTLDGGDGVDALIGLAGNDLLNGGAEADTLIGGLGNDTLNGGDGADQIIAQFGANILNGAGPAVFLEGGELGDMLDGGADTDFILGGLGNDTLDGGAGFGDQLIGGGGADTFVFTAGDDGGVVVDFVNDEDMLDFSDFGFADVNAALATGLQVGVDTFFDFNGDGSVTALINSSQLADLGDDIII